MAEAAMDRNAGLDLGYGTARLARDYPSEKFQEADMAHWRDTMVDRPEVDHPAEYAGGWVVSGLMVLATIFLVYHFGV
jgi:hypothetical protein